jgi:hypothetical protein
VARVTPTPRKYSSSAAGVYDAAFGLWLEAGHYASRPPGEVHGPFRTDVGCVVLELSFPNRTGTGERAEPIAAANRPANSD